MQKHARLLQHRKGINHYGMSAAEKFAWLKSRIGCSFQFNKISHKKKIESILSTKICRSFSFFFLCGDKPANTDCIHFSQTNNI